MCQRFLFWLLSLHHSVFIQRNELGGGEGKKLSPQRANKALMSLSIGARPRTEASVSRPDSAGTDLNTTSTAFYKSSSKTSVLAQRRTVDLRFTAAPTKSSVNETMPCLRARQFLGTYNCLLMITIEGEKKRWTFSIC